MDCCLYQEKSRSGTPLSHFEDINSLMAIFDPLKSYFNIIDDYKMRICLRAAFFITEKVYMVQFSPISELLMMSKREYGKT